MKTSLLILSLFILTSAFGQLPIDTINWATQDHATLYRVPDPDTALTPRHVGGYLSGTDQLLSSSELEGPGYNGSITGQNAQVFINSTPVTVVGAKFTFGDAQFVSGDSTSVVIFKLYKLDGMFINSQTQIAPAPGTLVSTDTVPLYSIQVLAYTGENLYTGAQTIYWNAPLSVPADSGYAIGFDITGLNPLDTLGLITSMVGNPPVAERSLVSFTFNENPTTWNSFLDPINGWDANVDLAIFPIANVSAYSAISAYICPNSTYMFDGRPLTQPGTYTDTLVTGSGNGYDSIVVLNLIADTIFVYVSYDTLAAILSSSPNQYQNQYQWINCISGLPVTGAVTPVYVGSPDSSYRVVISTNGCVDTSSCFGSLPLSTSCSAHFTLYPDTVPNHYFALSQASGTGPITYIWSWGDGSLPDTGATPSHTYTDSGYYYICLFIIDSTGCTSSYCSPATYLRSTEGLMIGVTVVTRLPVYTGIVSASALVITTSIYPNPATHQLFIKATNYTPQWLTIYDMDGRAVSGQRFTPQLDISTLASGLYFIEISNGNVTERKRFVKL